MEARKVMTGLRRGYVKEYGITEIEEVGEKGVAREDCTEEGRGGEGESSGRHG